MQIGTFYQTLTTGWKVGGQNVLIFRKHKINFIYTFGVPVVLN